MQLIPMQIVHANTVTYRLIHTDKVNEVQKLCAMIMLLKVANVGSLQFVASLCLSVLSTFIHQFTTQTPSDIHSRCNHIYILFFRTFINGCNLELFPTIATA